MGLDIRTPIGLMFLVKGIMMVLFGVMTQNDPMYQKSLGMNVNLIWGGAMIAFGILMLVLGKLGHSPAETLVDPEPIGPAGHH